MLSSVADSGFAVISRPAPPRIGQRSWAVLASAAMIGLPIVSGLLLGIALRPGAELLVWFALVPLAIVLRRSWLCVDLLLGLFLGGLCAYLLAMDWIRTSQAMDETFGPRALEWLALGVLGGVGWMLMFGCANIVFRRVDWPLAALLPLTWVSYEFLRKFAHYGIDEVGFPWMQLAVTQTDHEHLIQLADLGGAWSVTALIALVNGAVADGILSFAGNAESRQPRRCVTVLAVAGLGMAAAYAYGAWRIRETSIKAGPSICLVQSGILATQNNVSQLARIASAADVLLWPESAEGRIENASLDQLRETARAIGKVLLVTCDRAEGNLLRRSTLVFDPLGHQGTYDKQKLVPWNEFTPWFQIPGVTRTGGKFRAGARPRALAAHTRDQTWHIAPLICFDGCYPEACRGYWRRDVRPPDFFVISSHESSDATFALQHRMLRLARLRAIETRRAIVRNAYCGFSCVIDSCGRLREVAETRILYEPFYCRSIPIDDRATLYCMAGDWLPVTCCICVLLLTGKALHRGHG